MKWQVPRHHPKEEKQEECDKGIWGWCGQEVEGDSLIWVRELEGEKAWLDGRGKS